MSKGIVFRTIFFAVLLIGATFLFKSLKSSPEPVKPAQTASVPELKARPVPKPTPARDDFAPPAPVPVVPAAAIPAPAAPVELVAVQSGPPSARQLMDELTALSGTHGPITKEQAEKFKQNLAELVRQGAGSVPAIREFLDKNLNADYVEASGGDQLGYSSLRAGLFDALKQIGGPEAQAATLEVLQTTAMPSEILELAKNLEEQAPGQYREQILNAAHEALDMASANQLGNNVEVGPIFRIFEAFGESGVRSAAASDATKK